MSTLVLIMNILLVTAGIGLLYFYLKGEIRGTAWFKMGSFERKQYRNGNSKGNGFKKKN